ncbi:30S ribosomal protein S9 [Bacteroidia bacterium]|jgi:small subunit ribosomal protein S9|nr:30S ribosomal protein S9 [Bacteroidia bacterium]MDC0468289.1 30S ribosomal protein S9 [Bacteroidia bacterium]MDC0560776.1 30S ribosomal protein S9 [Bacteroidia bacterium]MDC3406236.1 30S ribosomal protein S9 [Bacteroidia bacterium]CAI8228229.1 MAG: 30S ribosomal protein S9 [Bacteroidia bacterium]
MDVINTIGRRKSSVARVYMSEGKGAITVNERPLEEYFASQESVYYVNLPLTTCDAAGKYDIQVNVDGGGTTGQADAIKLAIARALVEVDPENKPALRAKGLMTRDSRSVERKKAGQPKARKKTQFSKR